MQNQLQQADKPADALPALAPVTLYEKTPIALQAILDESLSQRLEAAALRLSKAKGFTPPHLLDQPETCFDIVCQALDSGLSPAFVAKSTFPIESSYRDESDNWHKRLSIGYESKLVRAFMQTSGLFEHIEEELIGDWSKVQGKWKWSKSQKGKDFQVKTYTDEDEAGLSVRVRVILAKGSREVTWEMDLRNMWPRNSTLWATDPSTQARYYALRRFCNLRYPGVLGGAHFEDDGPVHVGPEDAKDITPMSSAPPPPEPIEIFDAYGASHEMLPKDAIRQLKEWINAANSEELAELVELNSLTISSEASLTLAIDDARKRLAADQRSEPIEQDSQERTVFVTTKSGKSTEMPLVEAINQIEEWMGLIKSSDDAAGLFDDNPWITELMPEQAAAFREKHGLVG